MADKKRHLGIAGWLGGLSVVVLPIILGFFRGSQRDTESLRLSTSVAAGYETRDLNTRGVGLFFVGLSILGVLVLVGATATMFALSPTALTFPYPPASLEDAPVPTLPPAPRLESSPGLILDDLHKAEDEQLNSYGWVDQPSGRVRIPIDRAMDLILQRGLPARPGTSPQPYPGEQLPTDSSSGRTMDRVP